MDDSLTWTAHPAKIRKTATVLVIIFLLAVFILVFEITHSMLMVILAILLFTMSLSTYFFPTRHEITLDKVKIRYLFTTVEKDLSNYRSYYADRNGVLLSPFASPSRLENFRGLYLRYHQNKETVDAFVKKIFEAREIGD
jgi:ABC-type multidrug transport system fused ATPase/permease subunit